MSNPDPSNPSQTADRAVSEAAPYAPPTHGPDGLPYDPSVCWIDRSKNLRRDHKFQWIWETDEKGSQLWTDRAKCACGFEVVTERKTQV